MAKKPTAKKAQIESVRHKDKRKNIPTEELRDFVSEEEQRPQTVLYPRDPSLDPQLVWKGKDEQDRHDLEVPAVPIYIQEKIHPQALIEDFRRGAAQAKFGDDQLDLFADFNGLDDTNYNGESFFVRQAYFTGADEPYEKLKRALRAEIDEAAWSQLYSTRSRPFARPETGKIAVKVINHYGDEVLKVYAVEGVCSMT
jgi:hypothetical protein